MGCCHAERGGREEESSPQVVVTVLMVVVGAILTSMILNQVVLSYQAVEVVEFSVAFSTMVSVSSTALSELTPRSSELWHGDLSRRYFFFGRR